MYSLNMYKLATMGLLLVLSWNSHGQTPSESRCEISIDGQVLICADITAQVPEEHSRFNPDHVCQFVYDVYQRVLGANEHKTFPGNCNKLKVVGHCLPASHDHFLLNYQANTFDHSSASKDCAEQWQGTYTPQQSPK